MLVIKEGYEDLGLVKELFNEYASYIGVDFSVDLAFQDYDEELKTLPGKYDKPLGRLYLAFYNDMLAGCVAIRPFEEDVCEMKRLFVCEEFRGCKVASALVQKVIDEAKAIGYKKMLLDTLRSMTPAVGLYDSFGFQEIEGYYLNPLVDAVYYKLEL